MNRTELEIILNAVDSKLQVLKGQIDSLKDILDSKLEKGLSDIRAEVVQPHYDLLDFSRKTLASAESAVAQVKDGVAGLDGKDGADGKDGKDAEVDYEKIFGHVGKYIDDLGLKDGVDGKDGADGKDGENGKDAEVDLDKLADMVLERVKVPDPVPGPAGPVGEPGAPGRDAADPTDAQVFDAVKALYPLIRNDLAKRLPQIEHKGIHEPGEEYAAGDEVIKGDSSYRAKCNTTETPPHDDWQCIAKSKVGRRGEKGEPGPAGKPGKNGADGLDGVGIKDIVWQDDMMVIVMTNGDTKSVFIEDQRNKGED